MLSRRTPLRPGKPPFRVGDKVTTDFHRGEETLVRTVTAVEWTGAGDSGWEVAVRGGRRIGPADSDWFTLFAAAS